MGWCGGSALAESVWAIVRKYVPKNRRKEVARELIDLFEGEDADTMQEAEILYKDSGLDDCGD